ncbi:MAG: pyridoxine 5'-phosphate synthase [Paludibacteraceae bacterium]|nr:pyridoxine 5'-phosphate synthase [Paludibacteraceae bacterium]MBP6285165.1 pyridoxine 5'-phosphate synthase [Paludibacteraceae bacterium]
MTKLSVNINKVATIRNSRGGNMPNLLQVALDCERFGAQGITVHPRPDERHIRYSDVLDLKPVLTTEFNIEGYPQQSFMDLVLQVKPAQVTLVPDPPEALTSSEGWNTVEYLQFLTDIVATLKKEGIRTSIFVGTNPLHSEYAAKTGAERVEFYTGPYAHDFVLNKKNAIAPFIKAAEVANKNGLDLNAGHDLNLENLQYFYQNIPNLKEVSIGHALISDALYLGLEKTIKYYKNLLQ